MSTTIHDRLVAALERRGLHQVHNARSSKYTVYTSHKPGKQFYVGKAGALRYGHSIAASISVQEQTKQSLMSEAMGDL